MNKYALALLTALLVPWAAQGFSESDRALVQQAAQAGASNELRQRAGTLIARLANAQDMAALDYLIALRGLNLLRGYADSWSGRNATPEFEARVLKHFDDREVAAILIPSLYQYRNPDLFEALLLDAQTLARWRAERRRSCRAQVSQFAPPAQLRSRGGFAIQAAQPATAPAPAARARMLFQRSGGMIVWSYACASGADDASTDLDGRPFGPFERANREAASAAAVARTLVPGVESRLGPLLRDLSLFPAVDWSRIGARPEGAVFRAAHPPLSFLDLFRARLYSPDAAGLIEVLNELTPDDRGLQTDKDTWHARWSLHSVLMVAGSPEETRALAADIERAAGIENTEDRRFFLTWLIPLLGPVLAPAQIDLAALKARVLDRVPYDRVEETARLFTQVEAENRSLREPSAESLTRWITQNHYKRLVPWLLAHGASPNGPRPAHIQPPLMMAAYEKPEAAPMLLEAGADVNIRGLDAKTPLHAACDATYGRPERAELAKVFIARGADVNAASTAGITPLHLAASGSPQCVRQLLASGAKLEAADNLGRTPLAWAASNNKVETAKLLLDAGADPNREDREGGSPYVTAYDGKPETKALLEARGGRLSAAQIARRAKAKLMLPFYLLPQ